MKKSIFYLILVLLFAFTIGCNEIKNDNGDNDNNNNNNNDITPEPEETIISDEAIHNWLTELYEGKTLTDGTVMVSKYKDTEIELFLDINKKYFNNKEGKIIAPLLDTKVEILYFYDIPVDNEDGTTSFLQYEHEYSITLEGYGNEAIATVLEIEELMKSYSYIDATIELPVEYEMYSAEIKWYYNEQLLENGIFEVEEDLDHDFTAIVKCVATSMGNVAEKEFEIYVSHLNTQEKLEDVKKSLIDMYKTLEVEGKVDLIRKDSVYGAIIEWYSFAPHILAANGNYIQPLTDTKVNLQATVTLNKEFIIFNVPFTVKGLNPEGDWDKVEAFLERIALQKVKNQKFKLYGWETPADGFDDDYRAVPTQNLGYLFFYTADELSVTEDFIGLNYAGRPGTTRPSTMYITIHNTGMAHPKNTAAGVNEYIHSDLEREASWHFSVDDTEAYQELPLNEVAYHAGDGSRSYDTLYYNETYSKWCYGGGNLNSVALETCVYKGVDYNMVMRNTAKLVAKLLKMYDLTTTDVRQHWDFSGKNCPQVLRQSGRWSEQLELIYLEYFALTELEGVTFEWTSLTPEVLDDQGRVLDTRPTEATEVQYKVNVTIGSETKEFTFTSTLNEIKG